MSDHSWLAELARERAARRQLEDWENQRAVVNQGGVLPVAGFAAAAAHRCASAPLLSMQLALSSGEGAADGYGEELLKDVSPVIIVNRVTAQGAVEVWRGACSGDAATGWLSAVQFTPTARVGREDTEVWCLLHLLKCCVSILTKLLLLINLALCDQVLVHCVDALSDRLLGRARLTLGQLLR